MEHIVYVFEGFRLDAARRQLSSAGGVVVPLNSRAMEALLILVSRGGDLVTKKQLLEGVWPSAVVEDNNINQCILAIRKALGESAGSNRFIMTVTGRGYRFVAPVVIQMRESADAALPAAGIVRTTQRWRMPGGRKLATLMGIFAVFSAALVIAIFSKAARPPGRDPPSFAAEGELVVHLRSTRQPASPGVTELLACLKQRPDLHLQVEVHIVGGGSGAPLWTGNYLAGPQDLVPAAKGSTGDDAAVAAFDACQPLASR